MNCKRIAAVGLLGGFAVAVALGAEPGASRASAMQATIDKRVQAEVQAEASAIPIVIALIPSGPLKSVDDELAKFTDDTQTRSMAQEVKALQKERAQGRAIDEARLAELQSRLKNDAEANQTRYADTEKAVTAHNTQQFQIVAERLRASTVPGLTIQEVHQDGLVVATASADAVDKIASLPFVSAILSNRPSQARASLASAIPSIGVPTFWNHNETGGGIMLSVLGAGVNDHTALFVTSHQNFTPNPNVELDHETAVAGAAASRDTIDRGPAYGVSLYDVKATYNCDATTHRCDSDSSILDKALHWITASPAINVNVFSYTWGPGNGDHWTEQMFDYYADKYATSFVGSNGNHANGDQSPAAPGSAYNTLSVTHYDDNTGKQTSDSVPGPTTDGRKKPDLAAPGENLHLPVGTTDWTYEGGSSFAAPIAAGVEALIMQDLKSLGYTDNLQTRAKAIIINAADGMRPGKGAYDWWDPLWGWGMINADRAFWQDINHILGTVPAKSSVSFTFTASANTWEKATLVWKRHTQSITVPDGVNNLDLEVFRPSGTSVGTSQSPDDNVEQVKFQAPESGTYKLVVRNWSAYDETFVVAAREALH